MIKIQNVTKYYNGNVKVIDNLNLEIKKGEFIVLVGESGCGKTTTMRMINKLIEPTTGDILINGINLKTVNKNDLRRNIGYVIQNVGLFPHLTIEQNIATVPNLLKKDKKETLTRVKELMQIIELPYEEYAQRYPKELSGGQKQRIGVARALANDPDIILMDEPFSALDPITREQLQNELLRLQDELKKTIVFVTHDVDEAIKLGDKIAIMLDGKILQYDTPENILKKPYNDFVENFIGTDRLWKTPDMVRAKDIMSKKFPKISANRSVAHAIELMKEKNTKFLAVTQNSTEKKDEVVGLVGGNRLKDVDDHNIKMKDIMKTDFVKIPDDTSLVDVLSIREEKKISISPVVDKKGDIIGIITDTSILVLLRKIVPKTEEY